MNKISLIRGLKNRFKNNDVDPLRGRNLHESCNCAIKENMKEGALFNVIIKALNSALEHCKKSSKEITQIFLEIEKAIENVPGIKEAFDTLTLIISNVLNKQLFGEKESFIYPFIPEQISSLVTQWIKDKYHPRDERVQKSDAKKVRRMDSLSRILASQQASISVCSAVTIDLSTSTPQLIIGSNLGYDGLQDKAISEINRKINLLKQCFWEHLNLNIPPPFIDQTTIWLLAEKLFVQLFPDTDPKAPITKIKELVKAVYKVLDAVCYDNETFSQEEKHVFTPYAPVLILLPKINDNSVHMQIYKRIGNIYNVTYTQLDAIDNKTQISHIHAEQIMAYYLFKVSKEKPSTSYTFGVSKLCCTTCYDYLNSYPAIIVRGHHGKQYEGVAHLINAIQTPTKSSTRNGPTFSWPSPEKSPLKEALHKRPRSYGNANKRLFQEDSLSIQQINASSAISAGTILGQFAEINKKPTSSSPNTIGTNLSLIENQMFFDSPREHSSLSSSSPDDSMFIDDENLEQNAFETKKLLFNSPNVPFQSSFARPDLVFMESKYTLCR